jgi:sporulation protein YlmC with PRC-barrel domain
MGIEGQLEELLRQSVLLRGIRIGRVVDVILEPEHKGVIGFEVRCKDGRHRFLPRAAATKRDDGIQIDSPFGLLDTDQLDFYRSRGLTLRTRDEPAA